MGGIFAVFNVIGIYVPENSPVFIRANATGFLIFLLRFYPMLVPYLAHLLGQNVHYILIFLGFFGDLI